MVDTVALYIRISLEDGDMQEGKTESNSITNQRELLRKYLSEKEGFRGAAGGIYEPLWDFRIQEKPGGHP